MELEAKWAKGDDKAALDVSTASRGRQILMGATLVPSLVVALLAYQHPEWLPFFRGLRVFLGPSRSSSRWASCPRPPRWSSK